MASRKITHDWRQERLVVGDGDGGERDGGDEGAWVGAAEEEEGGGDDGGEEVAGERQRERRRRRRREEGNRLMRAVLGREGWELFELDAAGEEWLALMPPDEADLLAFRDVLWRKYQRKRVPYRHVEILDKMLE
jgi:hypothetical protein